MKFILVGNWKNYPSSLEEANILLNALSKQGKLFKKLSTCIAPPAPYMGVLSKKIKSFASLCSQDIFALSGTHTGFITTDILKNFGVKATIIGHSERRKLGETNKDVSEKIKNALQMGIVPIVCVGEEVHDAEGKYFEALNEQIGASLEGVKKNEAKKLVMAYEPVWAIGKRAKDAMQPEELSQMVIFIKKVLTEMFGRESADKMSVIYGGSAEPGNVRDLIAGTGVKGFLVGHASLNAKNFIQIAKALTE
ncbi:MAG: triose-phosphate isomerase [Patescibacteria group bacterium]